MTTTTITPEPIPAVRSPAPLAVRLRRLADWCVIGLFVGGLAVVGYGTVVREQPPLTENRTRHPLPPLSSKKHVLQDYPKWFEMYFGDRVGYRDVLLDWNQQVMYRVFDEPVSDLGWVGRDGWLFLSVIDPYSGQTNTPSVNDRVAAWADALADRHAFLKARGIEYIVIIPPDKSSVYPEFLRNYLARHPPPAPAAKLVELLAARGVPCVDPLPALVAEKGRSPHPMYYQRDSHWTHDGAWAAYRMLAAKVPGLTPVPDGGYDVIEQMFAGDLGRLVGAPETEWQESARVLIPRDRTAHREEYPAFAALPVLEPRIREPKPRLFQCAEASGPAAVFLHDSFGEQLLPYLTADCRRVLAVSSDGLEWPVIEVEKPAVVVQEIVARKLYQIAPTNPPAVRGFHRR